MQTITVQQIWDLGGKANGGFKGTDGRTYKCDAATHARLVEGMTFDSNVKPSEWQGKTFYWLPKDFHPRPATTHQAPPPPQQVPQANGQAAGNGYVPEREKQLLIVAQTLLKGFIGTNQFGLTDLPALEAACVQSARRIVAACK